jgi:hypothetical protein
MYSIQNFKSKKALKEAVKLAPVACFQPGPFGPNVADGEHTLEGPHFPEPHRFYARVRVVEGMIVKVLS